MHRARTALFILVACTLSACAPSSDESEVPQPLTTTVTSTKLVPAPAPASASGDASADVSADLPRIAQSAVAAFGGEASIALSDGDTTFSSGDSRPFVAWSTIKVPIAIAALQADPSLLPVAEAAITISDNLAAETLWAAVTPADVEAVLAAAGTPIALNTVVTRPGFSPFGQTVFSTADQAVFAATLPCVPGSGQVLDMMSRIAAEQRYGIGIIDGAQFKGGWGPDESGAYVVRQLGNVDGRGVAMTAAPADGTYETAQRMVSLMAAEIERVIGQVPPATCG